jgi:hypothetical protein
VQSKAGAVPQQWNELDISAPFLRAALESSGPLRMDLVADDVTPHLGPLTGMHSVIWLPIRAGHHTVGLGMVGFARPPEHSNLNTGALRMLGEEIATSVQHPPLSGIKSDPGEDVKCQLRLLRNLQSDAAGDSAFRRIARAARNSTGAEFIALGDGDMPPVAEDDGWSGAPEMIALLK